MHSIPNISTPGAALPPLLGCLRYTGISLVYVRGQVSGWIYRFSPAEPVQAVDRRGLTAMLFRPSFRMAQ